VYLGARRKWIIPLFAIPVLVSASRFFLGVHRIEDVAAGAVIGIVVSIIVYYAYEKMER
jgi:membrane-associated phospholipid phosphatase